jgi:uncharacterized membrane protein YjgN (DUF898 family)
MGSTSVSRRDRARERGHVALVVVALVVVALVVVALVVVALVVVALVVVALRARAQKPTRRITPRGR